MKSLRYLNKYFIKYKWLLLAGLLFTIASNYFYVHMTVFIKDTVDSIINNAKAIDKDEALKSAFIIGGIYIGYNILKGFFLFLMRQTIIKASRFIEYDLKNEIYDQYQELDYTFYKKNNTGDLMNRISEDVSHVRMYLGPGIMYTLNLLVLFPMVIYQMIMINGWLTLIVLTPLPIMSYLIFKVSSKINRISTDVQKDQSKLATIVQETFSGIRVVKAYSRESYVNNQFRDGAEGYKKQSLRLVLVNALFMPTILLLIGMSTMLAIYIGGLFSFSGTISFGGILAFIFFVNNLTWPFASVGWVTSLIQRAAASQTRINEFLNVEPEIKFDATQPFTFRGKVEFRNVSYTYPNSGVQAVKNLSFTIHPGETMAIIGRTGSGKSSILNLLMRQVDCDEGEILVDDKPLKQINLKDFRDQCGIVPQEVFLFSDSIKNNISFGVKDRELTHEELVEVAKRAHVHHNIASFPLGFETILGERGVNLSGGQKQRVSIARALIRNPKLLLLDDCLSAVDTETEEIILSNLKNKSNNQSTLIVSHRISSIRNAKRIIVLDNGQKIEEGNHDNLLNSKGLYFDIYNKQLAEEKEFE